jgi:hypothetical protein
MPDKVDQKGDKKMKLKCGSKISIKLIKNKVWIETYSFGYSTFFSYHGGKGPYSHNL